MALNIIHVSFNGQNETITKKRYQYDKGQVCVFDDIELPEAYKVIFSNDLTGENSIPMIGGESGVGVPDDFFLTGLTIYGWIYLSEGNDDGQTVKHFTIPIEKRVRETDEEPTPEEQTEIEQIIVALNGAVNTAETAAENAGNSARQAKTAAEHYPIIEDGYWYVWDVEDGDYVSTGIKALGDDGTSPTVTVTAITGGHKVTITDVDGDHVFDVMDGTDGNGIQSIAKTSTVGNVDTYTITYTNGQTTTFTVTNGITPTVDDALSSTSTNPVQNKKVKEALDNLDAGDIAYDETETYSDGTVGKGLSSVKAEINQLSDDVDDLKDALTDIGTVTGTEFIIKARFEQNGLMNQNDNWRMFSYEVNDTLYDSITVHTGMQSRGSITIPMIVFYKKQVSEITGTTWITLTTADVAGTGYIYPTGAAQEITETLNVPEGTQSCFVCIGIDYYNNGMRPSVEYSHLGQKVTDVQVNGTSIVNQGVANVPVASANDLGVAKVNSSYGIKIAASGTLQTNYPDNNAIKAGTNQYGPIVPYKQDVSTFYGLAKAASDTTQSASSNPVGTYTETAKQKINAMLEPQFRLIKEITITEETTNIYITTDTNGEPIALSDVVIYFEDLVATATTNCLVLINEDNYLGKHLTVNNLWTTSPKKGIALLNVVGGRFFGESLSGFTNSYNVINAQRNLNACGIFECSKITSMKIGYATTSSLTSGKITVYGR